MTPKQNLIAAVAIFSSAGFMVGRVSPKSGDSGSNQYQSKITGPRAASGSTGPGKAPRGLQPARGAGVGMHQISTTGNHEDLIIRMSLILNHPDSIERHEAWLRLIKGMSREEIAEAASNLRESEMHRKHHSEYTILLHAWVKLDPYGAMDSAESGYSKRTILSSWAANDPDSALHWARREFDGKGANPWMSAVIQGLASTDPKLATQLMMELPSPWQRTRALEAIHKHYLKQDPETARSWALAISDPKLRDDAIAKIAEGQSRNDPMGAAQWLLANPGEGAIQGMDQVMEQMTITDTQGAISFMETITDPTLKSRALEGIANELSSIDPHTTLALIDTHPELMRDDIVRELIWGARSSEPTLGANAIARIENDSIRLRTYRIYIGQWIRNDLEAASAWVSQNHLPVEIQQEIEEMVRRGVGMDPLAQPGH